MFLPGYFQSGAAWGEWGIDEIRQLVGYVPLGMEKLSGLWKAPIPDYVFNGWEEKGLPHLSFAYIISAGAGIFVVIFVVLVIGRLLAKKGN